jgi:hypothetical protein
MVCHSMYQMYSVTVRNCVQVTVQLQRTETLQQDVWFASSPFCFQKVWDIMKRSVKTHLVSWTKLENRISQIWKSSNPSAARNNIIFNISNARIWQHFTLFMFVIFKSWNYYFSKQPVDWIFGEMVLIQKDIWTSVA